jgi:hypothetical protein
MLETPGIQEYRKVKISCRCGQSAGKTCVINNGIGMHLPKKENISSKNVPLRDTTEPLSRRGQESIRSNGASTILQDSSEDALENPVHYLSHEDPQRLHAKPLLFCSA